MDIREGDLVEWTSRSGSRSTGTVKFIMQDKARITPTGVYNTTGRLNIALDKLRRVAP